MKKVLIGVTIVIIVFGFFIGKRYSSIPIQTGAPPYGEAEESVPDLNPLAWLQDWTRPEGPPTVGLQVGHWKVDEIPEELERLRGNTGASGGGKSEAEVNERIARETASILEEYGIRTEILPTTVPEKYWADVFIAIHADGSEDTSVSGFKIAAPWRDFTGNADSLVSHIEDSYAAETFLTLDSNITRNMRGYYAFSWWRFTHAIHPMTTAAIVETGFLTNASDRRIIVGEPERSAQGIAKGIIAYLREQDLLSEEP